ncbi:MFS transporter [Streptomyces sp. CSDS2]|uniref:MFS transporter n=1 Tax=Streptomyces sp. CSDS2 TaxID=3055051 RepID=UPI0025B0BDC2|nr:MFS transporter [Streptomyces sp. CSDS2]MDN3262594.1 MFS transporter [Streptomyces sp. CSDS2]
MSTPLSRPSYAAVLRVPQARRTFTAALTGRLSYATAGLAVPLSVTAATGSWAVSGVVLSLFGATTVLLMPMRAALVDRHGPRRVLLPMSLLYGALLALLAALTWRPGAPAAAVAGTAALAGCCAPPLGPAMRALWSALMPDEGMARRAYSLDAVAEELLYVSGPALVGALLGAAPAAAGILLSAALNVAGTCAFVTSPALPGPRPAAARRRRSVPVRGLLPAVVVALGLGLAISAVELLVLAFAEARSYDPALVPWVLGALSVGSALGGLAAGAVRWRAPARVRLCRFAAAFALVLAAAGLAPGLWTLSGVLALAGAFIAPALTTAYLLADETATEETRIQAGAWVNTGVNAGSSAGALAAGLLIGRLPLPLCFALAGAAALATAVAAAVRTAAPGHAPGPAPASTDDGTAATA